VPVQVVEMDTVGTQPAWMGAHPVIVPLMRM
jgi:hypothetical protein